MILIISTCFDKLSEYEFIKPVEDILKDCNVKFSTKDYLKIAEKDLKNAEKVIICGTALKDFNYLKNLHEFKWIRNFNKPVLGICSGMQILGKIFNNNLVEKEKIGQFEVNALKENRLISGKSKSYFLNSKIVKIGKCFEVLGKSNDLICVIKHKNKEFYGCLFHPEVLNPEIIKNFIY